MDAAPNSPEEKTSNQKELPSSQKLRRLTTILKSKTVQIFFAFALGTVFGILLTRNSYQDYNLAQQPVNTPTPIPETTTSIIAPNIYRQSGLDLSIDQTLRIPQTANQKDILLIKTTVAANIPCPQLGTCHTSYGYFKLTDEEGFLLQQIDHKQKIKQVEYLALMNISLSQGTKTKGDLAFYIPKDKTDFILRWENYSRKEITEIPITPTTYDPYESWNTYSNDKHSVRFKYPSGTDTTDSQANNQLEVLVNLKGTQVFKLKVQPTPLKLSEELYVRSAPRTYGENTWKYYYISPENKSPDSPKLILSTESDNKTYIIESLTSPFSTEAIDILETLQITN